MKKNKKKTPAVVDEENRFTFSALPEEEKDVVVNEIYERWKDIVYMNAKGRIRETFERSVSVPSRLTTDDDLYLSIRLHLVVGDIVQVLGRYRREKDGEEGRRSEVRGRRSEVGSRDENV